MDQQSTKKTYNPNSTPDFFQKSNDTFLIGLVVAIILVVLSIVTFYIKSKKKGRTVLLIGPLESGKTTIFAKLAYGSNAKTVTSVVANESVYKPTNGKPSLVLKDLPGHERVRKKFWESNKGGLRGIVCIIDSASGIKPIREGAEVLFTIFTDPLVNSLRPNILILANKQDLANAKGTNAIKILLEKEINTLKVTRSAGLKSTANKNSTLNLKGLGDLDSDFEFESSSFKVDFAEGIGKGINSELQALTDWLAKVA